MKARRNGVLVLMTVLMPDATAAGNAVDVAFPQTVMSCDQLRIEPTCHAARGK